MWKLAAIVEVLQRKACARNKTFATLSLSCAARILMPGYSR